MSELNRIIGLQVSSITYQFKDGSSTLEPSEDLADNIETLLDAISLKLSLGYSLVISNKFGIHNLQSIDKEFITNVFESKLHIRLYFSNDEVLEIDMSDYGFIGPEAVCLYGPNNLIVVWN